MTAKSINFWVVSYNSFHILLLIKLDKGALLKKRNKISKAHNLDSTKGDTSSSLINFNSSSHNII